MLPGVLACSVFSIHPHGQRRFRIRAGLSEGEHVKTSCPSDIPSLSLSHDPVEAAVLQPQRCLIACSPISFHHRRPLSRLCPNWNSARDQETAILTIIDDPLGTGSMVRAIFKSVVLATAGPLPGQFTDENLARWMALRKGTFSADLDDEVTHLLCTAELFKERGPRGMSSPSIISLPRSPSGPSKHRRCEDAERRKSRARWRSTKRSTS